MTARSRALNFQRENTTADLGAGLTLAMVGVPDAIASAILAGVNPIYAFNAMMVGMPVAGFFTGSQFMNCACTSAMMLVVAGVVAGAGEPPLVLLLAGIAPRNQPLGDGDAPDPDPDA